MCQGIVAPQVDGGLTGHRRKSDAILFFAEFTDGYKK
jgi:hypothetical protein